RSVISLSMRSNARGRQKQRRRVAEAICSSGRQSPENAKSSSRSWATCSSTQATSATCVADEATHSATQASLLRPPTAADLTLHTLASHSVFKALSLLDFLLPRAHARAQGSVRYD